MGKALGGDDAVWRGTLSEPLDLRLDVVVLRVARVLDEVAPGHCGGFLVVATSRACELTEREKPNDEEQFKFVNDFAHYNASRRR